MCFFFITFDGKKNSSITTCSAVSHPKHPQTSVKRLDPQRLTLFAPGTRNQRPPLGQGAHDLQQVRDLCVSSDLDKKDAIGPWADEMCFPECMHNIL